MLQQKQSCKVCYLDRYLGPDGALMALSCMRGSVEVTAYRDFQEGLKEVPVMCYQREPSEIARTLHVWGTLIPG